MTTLNLTSHQILKTIKRVIGDHESFVPLHEPTFGGNEWIYVKECIDEGWVSSVGSYVDRFERELAEYIGVKHAVAVVNGTAALHISLLLAGVKSKEEVLIPSISFVATANAVTYCGAVPHFIEVSTETLGIDPNLLEQYLNDISYRKDGQTINRITGRIIRAVVPMHTFGHPVDMEPLLEVCQRYGLVCIEDAAESLGSTYKNQHAGSMGLLGAISFNGNKVTTTGGGGAIVTNNTEIARKAKHLTTTAKLPHKWAFIHDEVGYNYRMPNLNAALGCAQLEQIDTFVNKKRALYKKYVQEFKSVEGVLLFEEKTGVRSNCWLNALILDQPNKLLLDEVLELTNSNGLMTRPVWTPLHLLPMYQDMPSMPLMRTEQLQYQIINIPSSPSLTGGR
nr:LegC family aminotransferase [Paenibacillus aquistagni]